MAARVHEFKHWQFVLSVAQAEPNVFQAQDGGADHELRNLGYEPALAIDLYANSCWCLNALS